MRPPTSGSPLPADTPFLSPAAADVFAGGGQMGDLARTVDWGATPIGPVERWPQSLRTAVSICLASRFPQLIWWGPELTQIYNDGYRPVLGAKHPRSMGQRGKECWVEIWDVVGPMYEQVRATGQATWSEDLLLVMERYGFTEETYFTFSYSPIRDETGEVGGVLVTCVETTARVLGERRLDTLRVLGEHAGDVRSPDQACRVAADTLRANESDVPFALLYLLDREGTRARLAGTVNLEAGGHASPEHVELTGDSLSPWPLARVAAGGGVEIVTGLRGRLGALPAGPWHRGPDTAVVAPVARPGQTRPAAILVSGASPALELDEAYRTFFDLVAGHVATAIANAEAYEEERRRAEALAELDRAKTTFFSNVSHEFRTPLTLMLAPLEEALETGTGAVPHDAAAMIHRNALRLLRLVNTMLDFSRIEAGRVAASYEPTDLAALTRDLASAFRSALERAGIALRLDLPALAEPVFVDRDMWEKIVLNLLSNAFKHTFEGHIDVVLRAANGAAELTVRDTGVGIPRDHLPHVFDRFHRVKGARSRTHEGSGIGLALVRELVRLHQGEIAVESTEGEGSTFVVRLPLGARHLPPDRVQPAASGRDTGLGAAPFVEEALRWLPDADAAPREADGGMADLASPDTGLLARVGDARVLVADDNADLRAYLTRLLGQHWRVETASDGAAALERARRRAPDLVLADVMMPGMDGFELVAALRADPALREIPVVLLSARAGEEARVEGLEAGADDYIVKPFSARELVARVGAALALARVRQAAAAERAVLLREVNAERERLGELFEQAPAFMAVLRGPDLVFERVNPRYLALIGGRDPIGIRVRDMFPELEGTPYFDILDRVYATGQAYLGEEARMALRRSPDGPLDEVFLNFVYHPLRDAGGQVTGIFVHGVDVTDQVAARKEVEEARTVAEAANRAKSDFLAVMSHELRTPLNAIGGYTELMELGVHGPVTAEQRQSLERIQRSQRHLLGLINGLLNYSRVEAGAVHYAVTDVPMADVLLTCEALIAPQARARGLRLRLRDCEPDVAARADREKVQQILLNLLTNAVKFTEPGGEIALECDAGATDVRVRVTDTGRGIAADQLERIFQPFVQVDAKLTRTQEGVGLGLAISRELARGMGGDLVAESAIGVGSTFAMTLPRA